MPGVDSAYAPTPAQAVAAAALGYTWWGFYLPRLPNTDPLNGWTPQQVQVVRGAGIVPVPICVPSPPAPADPAATATEYVNLARQYGCAASVSVCYNGSHINVTGPVWLPKPGYVGPVGHDSAIQNNTINIAGLSVDANINGPDFPALSALVCDLEYNTTYDSSWYQTFQQAVAQLSRPPAPPPPPSPPSPTQKETAMFLVYLSDTGAIGAANSQWLVTDNGLMNVVDDLTSVFGQPVRVSNGQAQLWSAGTPKK